MSVIIVFILYLFLPVICDQDSNTSKIFDFEHKQDERSDNSNRSFKLVYEKAIGNDIPAYEMIKGSKKFEALIRNLESTFQLPSQITIKFKSIESLSPMYENGQVIIPYNFFNYYLNFVIASGYGKTGADKLSAVVNLTQFALFHELSHGIIEVLDIPFLGKEEHVVDGLTVLLATRFDIDVVPLTAVEIFELEAKVSDNTTASQMFWGKHSISKDRMDDILCLVQGSNEGPNKNLFADVNAVGVDKSPCCKEYERINENWSRVFGSALK